MKGYMLLGYGKFLSRCVQYTKRKVYGKLPAGVGSVKKPDSSPSSAAKETDDTFPISLTFS